VGNKVYGIKATGMFPIKEGRREGGKEGWREGSTLAHIW
jgi:hypothetical protein